MTSTTCTSFNLVTEPWLPITLEDGSPVTCGMKEFFARAHEARGLNEPSPLSYTATLRMLLAVLHRALDGPHSPMDWIDLLRNGHFEADQINAYLDRWYHRFHLYHPEKPFAQVDSGVEMSDLSPVTRLLLERTSGNNPTLFDHSWDANPVVLSPGDAARAVLTAHQYAFAGSGGKFMQAPLVAGYCITLEGSSLFQTLMFNLQQYDDRLPETLDASGDAPWWEWDQDPPLRKGGLRPRGLTDLLTWRSRSFADMLEGTILRYQNRSIETAEAIAELIKLARKIRESSDRGEELGLTERELAFYDAIASVESVKDVLDDDGLREIAREVLQTVRNSASIDWTKRESTRAGMRLAVRRALRKHKFPKETVGTITQLIFDQAATWGDRWAA